MTVERLLDKFIPSQAQVKEVFNTIPQYAFQVSSTQCRRWDCWGSLLITVLFNYYLLLAAGYPGAAPPLPLPLLRARPRPRALAPPRACPALAPPQPAGPALGPLGGGRPRPQPAPPRPTQETQRVLALLSPAAE